MSHARKEILIKNFVQAIPSYVMSCFLLPTNIIHSLNSIGDKKICWKAWNFERLNFALLAKQCWCIIKSPSSLMTTCLQENLLVGRNLLSLGLRHCIGNGLSPNTSHGKWIPTLRKLTPSPYHLSRGMERKVSDLID
ncbi:hypothetical protein M9H77_06641 [Catharanthus roseus]|uniref:Uncharacterized protein n=1 Tax=Catharanthus roseus TaxID=4058 RepID=A0ACC0BSN5_CATRO|nr:hypothetical protein M9H77_06641 [Catharanthus roseus]